MSSHVEAYYPATSPMAAPPSTNIIHTPSGIAAPQPDFPDSQGSVISTVSSAFSAPALPSSSSNLSTSTTTETELTSPTSTNVRPGPSKPTEAPMPDLPSEARGEDTRARPAQINADAANASRSGDPAAEATPLESPATQGFKRTADGFLKGDGTAVQATARPMASLAHKRNKSMDTHRIGELSAQLKTRLSYAMVKVQNGWEKQSLDELEEVHSQRGSPNSAPGRSDRLAFDSPSDFERRRRPSGVSDNSDQMLMSPASDPLGAYTGSFLLNWRPGSKPSMDAAASLISVIGSQQGGGLAPAADIQAGRRRRSSVSHPPPPLLGASQRKHASDLGAGPRTPATPRAGILRMPSQQAEKDAVDTLLFMSSPNNSQRFPHNSQTAPSPLRAEAPQRRVMFDAYPPQERHITYQPQMPPPQHHYGPYAAHPAR